MTLEELYQQINQVLEKLNDRSIGDETKLDLEILVLQLKRRRVLASFDPLEEVPRVALPDLTELQRLAREVDREIENETRRKEAVRKIVAMAKIALKAAGVPLPV